MYVILGAPGSGKSQLALLFQQQGFGIISAGTILRQQAPKWVLKQINQGSLADHNYLDKIMRLEIAKLINQYGEAKLITDGFPKAVEQARWFLKSYVFQASIILKTNPQVLKQRLLKRGRPDDNRQFISKRLQIYQDNLSQIVLILKQQQIPIIELDGQQSPAMSFKQLQHELSLNVNSL